MAKARIGKAEVKANMAKEKLEITKQLAGERERELYLNETMTVLKHQADLYQVCFFPQVSKSFITIYREKC